MPLYDPFADGDLEYESESEEEETNNGNEDPYLDYLVGQFASGKDPLGDRIQQQRIYAAAFSSDPDEPTLSRRLIIAEEMLQAGILTKDLHGIPPIYPYQLWWERPRRADDTLIVTWIEGDDIKLRDEMADERSPVRNVCLTLTYCPQCEKYPCIAWWYFKELRDLTITLVEAIPDTTTNSCCDREWVFTKILLKKAQQLLWGRKTCQMSEFPYICVTNAVRAMIRRETNRMRNRLHIQNNQI